MVACVEMSATSGQPPAIGQHERARRVGRGRRLAGAAAAIVIGVGADLRVLIMRRDGDAGSGSRRARDIAARNDAADLASRGRRRLIANVNRQPR